jgi:hypothetical protein|nr:MAG TPA: hypothetical protein [Caudoviricetes sp.]
MKIEEVKRSLNKTVIRSTGAGSFPYLFTGCVLRKCDLGYYYQAELQDPDNENSVLICRLEEINERWQSDAKSQEEQTAGTGD